MRLLAGCDLRRQRPGPEQVEIKRQPYCRGRGLKNAARDAVANPPDNAEKPASGATKRPDQRVANAAEVKAQIQLPVSSARGLPQGVYSCSCSDSGADGIRRLSARSRCGTNMSAANRINNIRRLSLDFRIVVPPSIAVVAGTQSSPGSPGCPSRILLIPTPHCNRVFWTITSRPN